MNWTIQDLTSPHALFVRLSGKFERNAFRQVIEALTLEMDDLTFRPVLFDDRELDVGSVTEEELVLIRKLLMDNHRTFAGKKLAILMDSGPAVDVALTFKQMMRCCSWAVIDVFREERAAMEWLAEPF